MNNYHNDSDKREKLLERIDNASNSIKAGTYKANKLSTPRLTRNKSIRIKQALLCFYSFILGTLLIHVFNNNVGSIIVSVLFSILLIHTLINE